MCLFTQDIYPSIAEKDLECYKVVKMAYGQALTPYMNMPIGTDAIEGKDFFCANDVKRTSFNDCYSLNEVRCGYIHTFTSLDEAARCVLCESLRDYSYSYAYIKLVIFKCIIPKGTEYFTGYAENGTYYNILCRNKNGMPLNSYASERIKFVREITDM